MIIEGNESEIEIGWTFPLRERIGAAFIMARWKRLMLRQTSQFVDRVLFVVGTENFRSLWRDGEDRRRSDR